MIEYDAVVIGAGNGGLAAAATLAKGGAKTLLLERHNIPGGCATSFRRGRFEFEVALHQLSGLGTEAAPGPLRATLHGLDVLDRVEFVQMENMYRISLPGALDLTLPTTRDGVVRALAERFPEEETAIRAFFDLVYDYFNQFIAIFFMRDPEVSREKYPLYFRYALKPAQEVLDEHFRDPLLKLAASAYWCYIGVPPRQLPFGDLAGILYAYIEFKPWHIKGGSQALSNALVDAFLRNGGEVRFNCPAARITVADGRVAGVVTADGEAIATGCIIANASTLTTFTELIDRKDCPAAPLETMSGMTVGPSVVCLYIGLDCPPEALGIREETNFLCTHADTDRAFAQYRSLDEPPGMVLLTCFNISNPEASPPGTSQIAIVDLKYADPWLAIPPERYAREKYRYAEGLLAIAEAQYPGFRSHIEEIEVSTPLTHMRYLNHPGGAIYGFDQYAKDSRIFQPIKPALPGLFLAGAWAAEGGFQPTLMAGASAGRAALKTIRRK
ncbi:MAG: NAD(P)/FAD-dependent oxidoreductase [Syntrophales bacterium]|nr:NAD(P)/FAD-dependent oxidoreductase [Syntrophales bacterium]HOG07965.1 NAD(P)/FAD-dependent oxidoreductase [Syntrophales bacterium]HPB70410.1 NAD(P)/FAD-dependent oxidoreductase [Syntrophales bacterium]HQP29619.1 NAD(P)/FAD-dependent oxidoreductase [Syntrophales bacterium]